MITIKNLVSKVQMSKAMDKLVNEVPEGTYTAIDIKVRTDMPVSKSVTAVYSAYCDSPESVISDDKNNPWDAVCNLLAKRRKLL